MSRRNGERGRVGKEGRRREKKGGRSVGVCCRFCMIGGWRGGVGTGVALFVPFSLWIVTDVCLVILW